MWLEPRGATAAARGNWCRARQVANNTALLSLKVAALTLPSFGAALLTVAALRLAKFCGNSACPEPENGLGAERMSAARCGSSVDGWTIRHEILNLIQSCLGQAQS
jgi:hypothetical protein